MISLAVRHSNTGTSVNGWSMGSGIIVVVVVTIKRVRTDGTGIIGGLCPSGGLCPVTQLLQTRIVGIGTGHARQS